MANMNRNIEIKAKLPDRAAVERLVITQADEGPAILEQEDVFFTCPTGRLKLRTINRQQSELIFYQRDDSPEPKPSNYLVVPVGDSAAMRTVLSQIAKEIGVVRKHRTLYLIGPTRVHLDEVQGLGSYLELEVVLTPEESIEDGQEIAEDIMAMLGIEPSWLVRGAYLDLLRAQTN